MTNGANKFYQPGEQRAAKVRDLFGRIAPRYDLVNDLQSFGLHRLWKRRVARLAGLGPGQRALDVCCGTGDISFLLAKTGAEVTGLDFSEAMLVIAEHRRATAIRSPEFIRGDAQALPFADASFDAVTVGYGLRNLASWQCGLEEMWRVARPGGRLLVLDFGKPDNRVWRKLYFSYLRCVVPMFGRVFCGDAETYSYILRSLEDYPAQRGVAEKMRSLQCSNVRIVRLIGGIMTINIGEKPK